jgi:hypothetical protein
MVMKKQWIQSVTVTVDERTGALLVRSIQSPAQESFDLLEFPIWHLEGVEDVTWDIQFAIAPLEDPGFADPLLSGDTSVDFRGLLVRVDYQGVPGHISPVTGDGIATKLSEVDSAHRSGVLLVPLEAAGIAKLAPGKKYIHRSRQKARGHDEWSVYHDEIIVW